MDFCRVDRRHPSVKLTRKRRQATGAPPFAPPGHKGDASLQARLPHPPGASSPTGSITVLAFLTYELLASLMKPTHVHRHRHHGRAASSIDMNTLSIPLESSGERPRSLCINPPGASATVFTLLEACGVPHPPGLQFARRLQVRRAAAPVDELIAPGGRAIKHFLRFRQLLDLVHRETTNATSSEHCYIQPIVGQPPWR